MLQEFITRENVPHKLSLLLFLGTWETEITRWGRAYRPDDLYHCNTNNGTERLNEDLKYEKLEGTTRLSLIELLTVIIDSLYQSYI